MSGFSRARRRLSFLSTLHITLLSTLLTLSFSLFFFLLFTTGFFLTELFCLPFRRNTNHSIRPTIRWRALRDRNAPEGTIRWERFQRKVGTSEEGELVRKRRVHMSTGEKSIVRSRMPRIKTGGLGRRISGTIAVCGEYTRDAGGLF